LNSNEVTTPKLPPPPRSAQNSSGSSLAETRCSAPSAVTIVAPIRLSIVSPCLRVSQPKPPPRVRPATPVVELMPSGVARPCACASRSKSASRAPGPTCAVWSPASMRTARRPERSITRPPSTIALPAMWWPPPRTLRRIRCAAAKRTAAWTSASLTQRAISAGR
jgi:hypothetical protein